MRAAAGGAQQPILPGADLPAPLHREERGERTRWGRQSTTISRTRRNRGGVQLQQREIRPSRGRQLRPGRSRRGQTAGAEPALDCLQWRSISASAWTSCPPFGGHGRGLRRGGLERVRSCGRIGRHEKRARAAAAVASAVAAATWSDDPPLPGTDRRGVIGMADSTPWGRYRERRLHATSPVARRCCPRGPAYRRDSSTARRAGGGTSGCSDRRGERRAVEDRSAGGFATTPTAELGQPEPNRTRGRDGGGRHARGDERGPPSDTG